MSAFQFTAIPLPAPAWVAEAPRSSPPTLEMDFDFVPNEIIPATPDVKPDTSGKTHTAKMLESRDGSTFTDDERNFRDRFVTEYLIDMDARGALIRLGHAHSYAGKRAGQLLRETYVKIRIQETIRTLQPHQLVQRSQVFMRMWQEANNMFNDGSTRVAALAHCGKFLGMSEQESAKEVKIQLGVMIVPAMDAKTWDQQALESQAALKIHGTD